MATFSSQISKLRQSASPAPEGPALIMANQKVKDKGGTHRLSGVVVVVGGRKLRLNLHPVAEDRLNIVNQ